MSIQNVFFRALPFFTRVVLFGTILLFPQWAAAQQCDVDPEAIFKLYEADIGAYAIWDGVHGAENHEERYADGVLQENGHVVVVGTRESLGKPYPELILAEVDRRGRVVWETKRNVKGLDTVLRSVRFGKDIIVTALVSEERDMTSFWIGIFNERGALRVERIFRHKGGSVVYGDITPAAENGGLVMVLSTKDKRSGVARFSDFHRLNGKLQSISKRSFKPGPDNGVYNIIPTQDGQYLLSGYIDNARGRKSGWILKLSDKGAIIWQQQYPRGIGGELRKVAVLPEGSYIAIGTALPAQEDAMKAGWVMKLDPNNAEVRWQRYFRGDLDYVGKDLLVSKDGLISTLLEAKPVKGTFAEEGEKAKDYVRLVTLNPRGVIFDSQAFFQGEIADAQNMLLGPSRERILVGHTQIAYQKDGVEISGDDEQGNSGKPIVTRSHEGWVVAAPAVKSYEDPCKQKETRSLDSL